MEVIRGPKTVVKAKREDSNGLQSHQATVSLSSCDLSVPMIHVEVIYAFERPDSSAQPDSQFDNVSKLLEDGLARTLVVFKEYAGRMSKDENGRSAIALNEQGAAWFSAEANVTLKDLMPFSPGDDVLQLIPPHRGAEELLLVQFTRFKCGGFTLGIARHHVVADGTGVGMFMDAWASAVRGKSVTQSPLHDRLALMAQVRVPPQQPTSERDNGEHNNVEKPAVSGHNNVRNPPPSVKKLHFSPELLKTLKNEAAKDLDDGSYFTTVQSLAAHVWRCNLRARELTGEVQSTVIVAVNGRSRLENKLPDNYFGNVVFPAIAKSTAEDLTEKPLSYATGIIRQSIKGVDNQFVLGALEYMERQGNKPKSKPVPAPGARSGVRPISHLSVTSWVQQPVYKTDFGWGTPLFVGPPAAPMDVVILVPSYTQDGSIDVVTALSASDMERFERYAFEI
ncbi:hypothetical protein R1sor_022558 [Riccia sorocarpa]|uniref:Uncharacterized protein n=1 Tax=Riccia sorocarpa TaxID=122646 RepID=A0ABD3GM77_9MARC